MEFIMTICDIWFDSKIGFVIVGTNPEITHDNTSKLCRLGEKIVIVDEVESLTFKVRDIELSSSSWGGDVPNIGLVLDDSSNLNKIKIGDKVYKRVLS